MLNLIIKRFIRAGKKPLKSWPNDWVPFHWSRPEPEPGYYNAGDLVDLGAPKLDDLIPDAKVSDELKQLDKDDPVRKLFSVDHGKRSHFNKTLVHEHLKNFGLYHIVDYPNSMEAKIVSLTFSLRQLQEKIKLQGEDHRYNNHVRMMANNAKYRRYRYLCRLKELHQERFERIIKALDIQPPDNPINVPFIRPYRKKQMRRIALEYARDLKERKVEEFIKSIKKEQEEFKKEKEETLKWIEEATKSLPP